MRQDAYKIHECDRPDEVVKDALNVCFWSAVDRLDCTQSFARQHTDIDPLRFFYKFGHLKIHYAFILRKNFDRRNDFEYYFDIGCSTLEKIPDDPNDYFLFVSITEEEGNRLIKKYNIRKFK